MLPDHAICEQARISRDPRFDGLFFIAVTSTRIYCRPVCPAPQPRRENIRYFANAAAAEQEGFRPCLRCRPELAPGSVELRRGDAVVARALNLIDAGELESASLTQLAGKLAMSDRQLRRLFVEKLGAAPLAVHTTRRLLFAKQLLSESALPVTEVALASGFRSLRRFNAAFRDAYRLQPRELRKKPRAASGEALVLRLGYRPPYDFATMLAFLRSRALPGLEVVDEVAYTRVLATTVRCEPVEPRGLATTVRGEPVEPRGLATAVRGEPVEPRSLATTVRGEPVEPPTSRHGFDKLSPNGGGGVGWLRVSAWPGNEPALRLELHNVPAPDLLTIVSRIRRMFDLDADPNAIHAHLAQDARLREVLARHPGLRLPGAWDGFELAVRAVLGQQVSVAAARTLAKRLLERHGTPLEPSPAEGLHVLFPSAATIADGDLDGLGITGARIATIRGIARALQDGRVDFNRERTLDEFVARWTALPGIGAWTAHYMGMRALSHPDAFPADDLILRRALEPGASLTAKTLTARAESWRPWRAYSVLPLWFSTT